MTDQYCQDCGHHAHTEHPDNLYVDAIDESGWSENPIYSFFNDDDSPSTIVAYFPNGVAERVLVSTPRYRVLDLGEHTDDPYELVNEGRYDDSDYFDDESDAVKHLNRARMSEGLAHPEANGWVVSDVESETPRFVLDDAWEGDSEPPPWFGQVLDHIGWRSTDAWRGYTDFLAADGWVEWVGGWVTGYPDSTVSHKIDAQTLNEMLNSGAVTPPVPIVWCFGVTSNVFSTASSIFVPEGSEDIVNAWVDDINNGLSSESLARAFH